MLPMIDILAAQNVLIKTVNRIHFFLYLKEENAKVKMTTVINGLDFVSAYIIFFHKHSLDS